MHKDLKEIELVSDPSFNNATFNLQILRYGKTQWLDPLVHVPCPLPSPHTDWPQPCGPALLACRSADAPITRKPLTQDKSERFHLCRWVAPQSLVTGLALAN